MKNFIIPVEIIRPLKLSTIKALLVLFQVLLFAVLFFYEAHRIYGMILICNVIIMIPTLYYMTQKKELMESLIAPFHFKRALLIQLCMHMCIFAYWGYFHRAVYARIPIVIHQIAFVHLFYFVSSMYFRRKLVPSISLIPLTFSINLFLWFYHQIYFFHLILLALAILAKMFLTRSINGKESHIFNPSAIVLALATIIILLFPVHEVIYGPQIGAIWIGIPHFDIFLFTLGCITLWTPNRYLMAMSAIGIIILGDYFTDTYAGLPLFAELAKGSVLLGCTLLICDPATSPNSKAGQILFGLTYGVSVAVAFTIFSKFYWNTYYDKLFFVCMLNYFSPNFDRVGVWIENKFSQFNWLNLAGHRAVLLAVYVAFFWTVYPRFERMTPPPFFMNYYTLKDIVVGK